MSVRHPYQRGDADPLLHHSSHCFLATIRCDGLRVRTPASPNFRNGAELLHGDVPAHRFNPHEERVSELFPDRHSVSGILN